jgi:hypothetical protein
VTLPRVAIAIKPHVDAGQVMCDRRADQPGVAGEHARWQVREQAVLQLGE